MGRIYAYCRVSKNDGTMTIENQIHAIKEWAEKHNLTISAFYKDECKGDTREEDRRGLSDLFDNLDKGDTVVVAEVFRLYRGFSGLQRVYTKIIKDKKAEFITLNPKEKLLCTQYGYDEEDIMQETLKSMTLLFMALFSELEKQNISRRTKVALAERVKDKKIVLGRPKAVEPPNFAELYKSAKAGQRTHASVMKDLNLKRTTYYKLAKDLEDREKKKD